MRASDRPAYQLAHAEVMGVARFITTLKVEHFPGSSRLVRLVGPLHYYSCVMGRVISVPTGFVCDKESIGRWPLVYWLCGESSPESGVLHDYLYRKDAAPRLSRSEADAVYREACGADSNNFAQRWMKWCGVRVGGFLYYHKYAVRDIPEVG